MEVQQEKVMFCCNDLSLVEEVDIKELHHQMKEVQTIWPFTFRPFNHSIIQPLDLMRKNFP